MPKCTDCRKIVAPTAVRRVPSGRRTKGVCPKCAKNYTQVKANVDTPVEANVSVEANCPVAARAVEANHPSVETNRAYRLFLTPSTIRNIEKAIGAHGSTDNLYRIIGVRPDEPERDPERFVELEEIGYVEG